MKKRPERFSEFLGWYGVLAILVAYGLLSFEIVSSDHLAYHIINLTGGLGIIIDAYYDKNLQPVVLNVIWVAIALYAIFHISLVA